MNELVPITALGASKPVDRRFGPLRVTEDPDTALASLTLRRGTTRPAPMGLDLPEPGGWVAGHGIAAFWMAPDQWMIEAPGRAAEDFAAALAAETPGCSVTEQTDGWTVLEIASDAGDAPTRALLEKLVNLDAVAFTPGSATRTGLHHMGVFVIRRSPERLAIIGMRSLAAALWHALEEAAKRLEGATA